MVNEYLNDNQITVKEHLQQLKKLIMHVGIISISLFMLLFMLSKIIINYIIIEFGLILNVLSPFDLLKTQIKVSLTLMLVLMLPVLLFYLHKYLSDIIKNKSIINYMIISLILALSGFVFGVMVFARITLYYFNINNANINNVWGVLQTMSIIFNSGLMFAVILQSIIIVPLLVKWQLIEKRTLQKSRKYVIMILLVLSAIMTTPDPFTQVLMSIPMYVCYETGILLCS